MARKKSKRAEQQAEDLKVINADPRIGPAVKALLNLSAFAPERKRYADKSRARKAAEAEPPKEES